MTFLDLLEGGGEDTGKDCFGGARVFGRSSATRVRRAVIVVAASRCAGFVAGKSLPTLGVCSGRLARASAFMTTRAVGSDACARRVSEALFGGAGFVAG
jgi:hypothetical protein